MKVSPLLKKFLSTGNKPANQREASALLDESRSLLVSKLPTTAVHVQNLTTGDIDAVLTGTAGTVLDRAVAVHRANQAKPAPKKDRIYELCKTITAQARKPLPKHAKPATATKGRTDKRQGDLPLTQWSFGHLATAALAGDQLAVAEIQRRGYEINANSTFSKKA